MHESKDPAIKLFGKNIPLPSDDETTAVSGDVVVVVVDRDETGTENKDYIAEEKESSPKTPSIDEEKPSPATAPATMKKPEKILRCPRCNSMDTKFCYFNNYNVNQPRHFCKSCQRYWTSGGSMRNVPVGAGRRKSKPSSAAGPPPPPEYSHVPPPRLGSPWGPLPPSPTAAAAVPFYPFWWVPPPFPSPAPAKRPRDQEGGKVLVPKTLRIDDPAEAAKSSIWAALGICSGDDGVGMFGGFRKKSKECFVVDDSKKKKNDNENDLIRAANPAALSRSINFHETS